MTTQVLVVDDDSEMTAMVAHLLRARGYGTVSAGSAAAALDHLGGLPIDVIVTDLRMAGTDGLELCERVVASRPDVPVIVLTALGTLETAVAAVRAGAFDFVSKPVEPDVLLLAVARAARHRALREEVRRLRAQLVAAAAGTALPGVTGESAAMQQVRALIDRVADAAATVLITGESGTGKEVVARALHARSQRAAGPFIAVNCAAVPEALLESELFGHKKGAFTDARTDRKGLFLQAEGGTLFLDEIGELPLGLQPKLLRALQDRVVRPVGSDHEVPFHARLVAATNRDLETAVEERRFREDLYYRLNVVQLALPPLRARGGDVLALAREFVAAFAARGGKAVTDVAPEACARLLAYSWPGNVRELQNAMERAVALARYEQIVVDDLPERIQQFRRSHVLVATDDPREIVPLEQVERQYILRAMEAVGGNKTLASEKLAIDRKTLYRKLERYGYRGPG